MNPVHDTKRTDPLRVLVLTSDRYPPFRPAAKAIFGEEFERRGHVVDWIMQAQDPATTGGKCRFGNGIVYLAATRKGTSRAHRLKKHLHDFFNDFKVFSITRKNAYDIVQVKDKYIAAILALLVARMRKAKFCYWLAYPHAEANLHVARHGMARYPMLYRLRGMGMAFLLYRIILPRADHIFVQSEQMQKDIAARGVDCKKMTPIPGSLTLTTIPYKRSKDPGPEAPVVLYVGTLNRKRRLEFVIRAFRQVLDESPSAMLWMVGGGVNPADEAVLTEEVDKQGIDPDKVVFHGEVPMSQVWQYIERSAVCLSPIYPTFVLNQGSPTKLIEYMAMARPVVANEENPEQAQVLQESLAGFGRPWDESEFAAAIVTLLKDPELAREMGQKGRRWVESHRTSAVMADLVEKTYYSLLARGS